MVYVNLPPVLVTCEALHNGSFYFKVKSLSPIHLFDQLYY